MPIRFTQELGNSFLKLIEEKNWKVCYEFRHHGDISKRQTMEDVFGQVAETLEIGPRYHLFPGPLGFNAFTMALAMERVEPAQVTIAGERRIVFGFGLREDHCFFVTHPTMDSPAADRQPKDYEYMRDALETLEPFGART